MPTPTWQEAMIAVEKLPVADQLRLVSEVLQKMSAKLVDAEPIDLLTLAGVGAEIWAKIDVDAYLNQERDSWQN
ncbi:MAG: hypothetical protein D6796_00540 [Caldilineae bacterium]|nr:MAG: hypothetical protein D6796_00540 [Caldilineae bacterium]